jgi:DNA-binding transcriptional ArsR family regulator
VAEGRPYGPHRGEFRPRVDVTIAPRIPTTETRVISPRERLGSLSTLGDGPLGAQEWDPVVRPPPPLWGFDQCSAHSQRSRLNASAMRLDERLKRAKMDGGKDEMAEKGELTPPKRELNQLCDRIFNALADPTRRAIFEHLSSGSELTVRALIEHSGVSQQAVAKHLAILEHAGLVICHPDRRANYYTARLSGAAPLLKWLSRQGILLDQETNSPIAKESGTSSHRRAPSPLSVRG